MNPLMFCPAVLSVDIGSANTRAVWGQAGESNWSETIFRSVCPPAVARVAIDGLAPANHVAVEAHGEKYLVGPHADRVRGAIQIRNPDFINSPHHEALLLGAWYYMVRDMGRVVDSIDTLVLGLSVSEYNTKREALREIGLRPRRVPLPAGMRSADGNPWMEVSAKKVRIVPQALGMLVLASEQPDYEYILDKESRTLAIDVGYSTFDWLVADGSALRMGLSDSIGGGVVHLIRRIARQISFDHGVQPLDFMRIEASLAKGELHLGHTIVSMEPYRRVAEQEAALVVDMFLQRFHPEEHCVTSIVLSGGGASLFFRALQKRLPKYEIHMLSDSAMSNARGCYLLGL